MTEDIEVTIKFTIRDIDIIDKNDNYKIEDLMTLVSNIISEEGVDNFIFDEDYSYEVIDVEIV